MLIPRERFSCPTSPRSLTGWPGWRPPMAAGATSLVSRPTWSRPAWRSWPWPRSRERYAAQIEAGLRAIETNAHPDGSYRLGRGRPQAAWPTALVLFTRAALGHPTAALAATAEKLTTIQGRVLKADPEVADMQDIDLQLLGWPWAEETFSWVEPTAWACLALRAVGKGDHPRVAGGAAADPGPGVRHRRGELRQPVRPRQADRADPRADRVDAARPPGGRGRAADRRGEGLPAGPRGTDDRPRTPRLDQAGAGRPRRRTSRPARPSPDSTSESGNRRPSRSTRRRAWAPGRCGWHWPRSPWTRDAATRSASPTRHGWRTGQAATESSPTDQFHDGRSGSGSPRSSAGS